MAQNQRAPLVVPILLITVGALFLYANYRPAFDPWPILRAYWPLILVFVGLGKMWDSMRRRENSSVPAGSSIGSTVAILAFVLVLILLFWHGHALSHDHRRSSFLQHQSSTVDRQKAQAVHALVQTGAGQLTVAGGANHLLDADFSYSDSFAAPNVEYHDVPGGTGELQVSQDHDTTTFGVSHNDWNLRFSNDVPLELEVKMGAGKGDFHLRDLPLTGLSVEMGAGQVDADLTGDRKKDLDVNFQGGVGQATIRLPKNVGVVVEASGGIGSVNSHGLKHDGDQYTNDAYGKTPATIHVHVQGGIGSISLIQEP